MTAGALGLILGLAAYAASAAGPVRYEAGVALVVRDEVPVTATAPALGASPEDLGGEPGADPVPFLPLEPLGRTVLATRVARRAREVGPSEVDRMVTIHDTGDDIAFKAYGGDRHVVYVVAQSTDRALARRIATLYAQEYVSLRRGYVDNLVTAVRRTRAIRSGRWDDMELPPETVSAAALEQQRLSLFGAPAGRVATPSPVRNAAIAFAIGLLGGWLLRQRRSIA